MEGQTIFAIIVGVALACFSLVMVGYSFFRNRDAQSAVITSVPGSLDGRVGVDAILDSIDTLELEHQLGNIPEEQYVQQMDALRLEVAVEVRDLLDSGVAPPELVLEREVQRARFLAVDSWLSCPQCDAPLPVSLDGDLRGAACPHCNAALSAAGLGGSEGISSPASPRQPQDE